MVTIAVFAVGGAADAFAGAEADEIDGCRCYRTGTSRRRLLLPQISPFIP